VLFVKKSELRLLIEENLQVRETVEGKDGKETKSMAFEIPKPGFIF